MNQRAFLTCKVNTILDVMKAPLVEETNTTAIEVENSDEFMALILTYWWWMAEC